MSNDPRVMMNSAQQVGHAIGFGKPVAPKSKVDVLVGAIDDMDFVIDKLDQILERVSGAVSAVTAKDPAPKVQPTLIWVLESGAQAIDGKRNALLNRLDTLSDILLG